MTIRAPATQELSARRLVAHGRVQGVGFRPAVHRLAAAHHLAGSVRNTGGVVEIVVEGPPERIESFLAALRAALPSGARVNRLEAYPEPVRARRGFTVEPGGAGAPGWVPPDVATCRRCLAELTDAADRRFRYPFTTCATCGPRFTILRHRPWDRAHTTMDRFSMCRRCRAEHADPADRRFAAETVSCPDCGPRLAYTGPDGRARSGDPVRRAAAALAAGAVVAVKALGGYHLAVDATDPDALARLRSRKSRPTKPFAVMVADLRAAEQLVELTPAHRRRLASPEAPIVLAPGRGRLPGAVAPGLRELGIMLPATPVHHLLAAETGRPLVMTSGNRSGEPICVTGPEAYARLGGIADGFLTHDRDIAARADDSVLRVGRDGTTVTLRRSRGFAGLPIPLGETVPAVLGVGAHLHTALCLAAGREAFLSAHVGDLDTAEALAAWDAARDHLEATTGLRPEVIACDAHPDLPSTRLAERLAAERGLPLVRVQHHHAHLAAVAAEHGHGGPLLGLACDGLGWGGDGTVWGGELLALTGGSARRLGRLRPVRQPGGDAAVRRPVRSALAHAHDAGCAAEAVRLLGPVLRPGEAEATAALVRSGAGSPWASSTGRLFDAVAALCGLCADAAHDGEPAVRLEQAAGGEDLPPYPVVVAAGARDGLVEVDTRPVVAAVVADRAAGVPVPVIAARFHATVAEALAVLAAAGRRATGTGVVALGGGVFANLRILGAVVPRLEAQGLRVLRPETVPPGDGGLALGQVLVAARRAGGGGC